MVSACPSEVFCGSTTLTPAATMRSSALNTTAPNGPPVPASRLRRDSSIASATFSSSVAQVRVASTRSEEHTSELQSLMRISYAGFCLKKKKIYQTKIITNKKYKVREKTDIIICDTNENHMTH